MGFQAPDEHRAGDLLLRSYRPGDGPELNRATVSSYRHLRRFMPWARADTTDEHGEETARRFRAAWLLGEREWVVGVWRGAKLAAGTGFHLHGRPLDEGVADVGMWVRADEAGRGLGTRVLEAMVDWADGAWPFYRLTWGCDARRAASGRTPPTTSTRPTGATRCCSGSCRPTPGPGATGADAPPEPAGRRTRPEPGGAAQARPAAARRDASTHASSTAAARPSSMERAAASR